MLTVSVSDYMIRLRNYLPATTALNIMQKTHWHTTPTVLLNVYRSLTTHIQHTRIFIERV